jgi:hypothetical protein
MSLVRKSRRISVIAGIISSLVVLAAARPMALLVHDALIASGEF